MRTSLCALLFVSLPALAATPLGVIEGPSGKTYLYAEQGSVCVGRAYRAEYIPRQGVPVGACWTPVNGGVSLVYFDGDSGTAPSESIKKPETL